MDASTTELEGLLSEYKQMAQAACVPGNRMWLEERLSYKFSLWHETLTNLEVLMYLPFPQMREFQKRKNIGSYISLAYADQYQGLRLKTLTSLCFCHIQNMAWFNLMA